VREAELDRLMGQLARGDRSAFEPLYFELRPRAIRLARKRLGESDANDVAQNALLKIFSRASEFTPGRPCLPWFYAIVANEIQSSRRRQARFTDHDEVLQNKAIGEDDAEAQLVAREMERALELAIDELDEDGANAINAMLGNAPLPNLSAATFRKRVSRAYAKLRLLLGGHDVR
jgi:RNA polymerase sigma-70 factor (ECF subfamily)